MVMTSIKQEELNILQEELKNIDMFNSAATRFLLKRELKKLNNFIDDLQEYDDYEADEIYDETVKNWEKFKKLHQPKVNKLRNN